MNKVRYQHIIYTIKISKLQQQHNCSLSTYVKKEKLYGPSTKIVSKQSKVGIHTKIQHQQRLQPIPFQTTDILKQDLQI